MRWLTTVVILTLLITGVYFGINWFGGDKNIDKSGGGYTDLPAGVLSNRNAVELDLSNNNLTSLPAEIGQLTKLEVLILDDNKLEGAL
ncbi:MAG TPA: leucine-rich repeat domain-containing protein, partial [Patescibacteria group bacterium]|nr:leucine-rich repeat domain-containing protein [Patescibacteria group bacterium]